MATSNYVQLKFEYYGTNYTRTYKLDNVSNAALSSVKDKVKAVNAIMNESEMNAYRQILAVNFVVDEFTPEQSLESQGYFKGIAEATIVTEQVTKIPLF